MISLPPPPPAEVRCIKPAEEASANNQSFIVISGDEASVQKWLDDAVARGSTIIADRRESGRRYASVQLPRNTAYRTISAMIYSGQASGLSITMKTEPPICGAEAK